MPTNGNGTVTAKVGEPLSADKPTRHTIKMAIRREAGNTLFDFDIPEKIEAILKANDSAEVLDSQAWPGLKFYKVPEITASEQYKALLANYNLFDNYGQEIMRGDRFNIAWLRTVGGKGTIKVPTNLGTSETASIIRNAVNFVREYYNNYYKPMNIKGEVVIEL